MCLMTGGILFQSTEPNRPTIPLNALHLGVSTLTNVLLVWEMGYQSRALWVKPVLDIAPFIYGKHIENR